MKWICAPALAAVLLFACTKTETTTETSGTATETAVTSTTAMSTDTSSTIVPAAPTQTMSTNPASGTSSTNTNTSTTSTSSTDTTATGSTGATGATGPTGSTTTTHTENMQTPGAMISSGSDLVAEGLATYKAKGCTGCHGATGAADTAIGKKNNIRDFHSPDVQKQSDVELTRILKEGKGSVSKMAHKSKNLTDEQAKSLVAWIRTLK